MKMIQTARPEDYKELLDFENRIFNVRFLSKVPKLYTDETFCAACHGIIREEDRIIGGVAVYPTALTTLGGTLKAVGVGSVAVDPAFRGKGYMKELMQYCDDAAKAHGAAMSFLSGYRQRYEPYGFVPCGTGYVFEVSDYCIAHTPKTPAYTFETLKKNPEGLPDAIAAFSRQPYRWQRDPDQFFQIVSSWEEKCFIIRDERARVRGYLLAEKTRRDVSELVLADGVSPQVVLAAFARSRKMQKLRVHVHEGQDALRKTLCAFGEHIEVNMPAAFKIHDFRQFIEVLGTHKAKTANVLEGSIVLKIGGETLRITMERDRCTAVPTADAPDLTLTAAEATVALTTPLFCVHDHPLLRAWGPLCPLGISHCDEV